MANEREQKAMGFGFLAPTVVIAVSTLAAEKFIPACSFSIAIIFTGVVASIFYLLSKSFTDRSMVFLSIAGISDKGIFVNGLSWTSFDILSICIILEGVCLLTLSKVSRKPKKNAALVWLSILFCLLCVLSVVFSPLEGPAITPTLRELIRVGSMVCVGLNVRTEISCIRLQKAVALQMIIYVVAILAEYLSGQTSSLMAGDRLETGNVLSFIMLIGAPLLPAFGLFRAKLAALPFWICAFSVICLTMSRTAFILVALDLILLIYLYATWKRRNTHSMIGILLLVLPLCLIMMWTIYSNYITQREAHSDLERIAALQGAIDGALAYPLHGIGFAGWIRLYELNTGSNINTVYSLGFDRVISMNPHNAYARVALDLGIPGLCVYCCIMGSLIVTANRLRTRSDATGSMVGVHAGLFISVVNLLVSSLFIDTVESPQMWCLVVLCIGGANLMALSRTVTIKR